MNALGVSQTIPFPGNLGLRSDAALGNAQAMAEMARMRERDLVAAVKKTYFEYFALVRELEVHREHVKILDDFEKVSDARFRTGSVPQQDVLKPQVELVMLHNDVLSIEQRIGSAKAALNALLHRPPEAPLGPPKDLAPADERFDLRELSARALEARPEVRAAAAKTRGARAALDLAERESVLPDFSVGLEYMQVPGGDDAWGGMFSINLPWFTGKRAAEARMKGHVLRAEEIALEAARSQVLYEVRDAWLRVEAARLSLRLVVGELLPKSRQSVEVSRAGYEKDKASILDLLDGERSLRDVRLKHHQAAAQYEAAVADLERAVGTDLRRKP
jgi:outer membrane protein TolC